MPKRRAGAVSLVTLAFMGVLATVANLTLALATRQAAPPPSAMPAEVTPAQRLCGQVRALGFGAAPLPLAELAPAAATCRQELLALGRASGSRDRLEALFLLRLVPGEDVEAALLSVALTGDPVPAAVAAASLEALGVVLPGSSPLIP